MNKPSTEPHKIPSPPRGVALSGILFSVLYIIGLVLVRLAIPADPAEPGAWLVDPTFRKGVRIALSLVPFAGIAFLWFIAVLRNRIGLLEDRFYSTLFLGSGLLFVGMLFVAVAVARGLLGAFATGSHLPANSETYAAGRVIIFTLMNTFALKMAAMFMFVTSTIGLSAAILPRWVIFTGYLLGLVLLLTITDFAWIALLFPFWVLLVCISIIVSNFRQERAVAAEDL